MVRLIAQYLRPYRAAITLVIVLISLQVLANLYLPRLNADIINYGVLNGDLGYILRIGAIMLGLSLLLGVVSVIAVYYSARTAMAFGRDLRGALFRRVELFSLREMNQFGAPTLITRNTNDVQQVQMMVLLVLTMMITAPLTAVGGVLMALRTDVELSALLLVLIPLMALVVGVMIYLVRPLFEAMQVKIDTINGVLRENLTGVRVIRAFVRTSREERRFAVANQDLTDTTLRVTRTFAALMPIMMLIFNLSSVAIIWFGGHLVNDGAMQVGDLTAFLSYIMQILFSVLMAVMLIVMVPRAAASSQRIQAVLNTVPEIADPPSPRPAPPANGVIEYRDVEFRYPGAQDPVLRGINLTMRPGQTTAIIGSTGSGKTTLVNLIPRLYDVSAGAVLVDGVDVRDMVREQLWERIGLVPQRAFLFSGTIASNVRFGKADASESEIWEALRIAQASEFVSGLPEQLAAPIDQGGANVSGGQRQRLAIARALVRTPPILVFDDSFSALDYATDSRLRAALRPATRDATVLIVAQRVSTILHADQIVVLDHGRTVGVGTHHELMESCEIYREIVYSQLTAAEAS